MRITRAEGITLAMALLEQRNARKEHAFLQADLLLEAELRGHPSHGLQRLPRILARIERGLVDPRSEGHTRWRSDAVLEVDGRRGLGPVVAMAALRQLRARLPKLGVCIAAVRNSNHLGMLAYYVEKIASEGAIGIAMSSSEALVHPYGGTRAMLGTNPIAIATPTGDRPFVLDLATSVVSMGKIHHFAASGKALSDGWARDDQGRPTTNAEQARTGAIAPFGGAKGYGLGLAVELMVAALVDTSFAPEVRGTLDAEFACNKGDLFIVVDAGLTPGLGVRLSEYLDRIRSSQPANPETPVSVPGDGAARRAAAALRDGFSVEPGLWRELNSLLRSHLTATEGSVL
jgi:L-2-hydroxycarboxylate dehydrogenase (NAD+)